MFVEYGFLPVEFSLDFHNPTGCFLEFDATFVTPGILMEVIYE